MNELEKWCKNKPYFLAIAAPQIAASATTCYEFLLSMKSGEKIYDHEIPSNFDDWISLYKNHRHVEKCLKKTFEKLGGFVDAGIEIWELFKNIRFEIKRLGVKEFEKVINTERKKLKLEDLIEINDFWQKSLKLSLDDIEKDFKDEVDQYTPGKFKKHIQNIEMIYFLRIVAPCWLLYSEPPGFLLRKARSGDPEALDKVLRLDSLLIHDPKISKLFQKSGTPKPDSKPSATPNKPKRRKGRKY